MLKANNEYKGSGIYPAIIWTMGAGFFFYKYLVQVSPSVMTQELMNTFQVNGAGLGHLSAFYFYAYLIMQIPVGMMLDKYSPRLLTSAAILLCALSTYLFSQTHELWFACFSRALIGFGAAFVAVSGFKLAIMWFSPKRFALLTGLYMTAAMLGAVGGQMPLSILVQQVGWRGALAWVSVIGVVFALLYFAVVRDKPLTVAVAEQSLSQNNTGLTGVIKNRQTWLLSLYSGLAFAPFSVFGGLWGVPFLQTVYQLSPTDAALAVSYIFIGFALGAPFLGWLSDFMGRRKPILWLGTILALVSLVMVLYLPGLAFAPLCALLFIFGFALSGFVTSFAMIRELFPVVLAATVIAIMNSFNSLCEALFEPLIGALLDWSWNGITLNGVHQFSAHGYRLSMFLLPITLVLALLSLFFVKETYCQAKE